MRRWRWRWRWLAGLLCLAAAGAEAAGSLRCGSRLVSEGDRTAELIGACGDPAYRDVWGYAGPSNRWIADVEEWYYNFGPSQLLRVVRLRNGRIVSIDSEGYGFHAGTPRRCTPGDLVPGMSKFRVVLACGEPLTRESRGLLRRLDHGSSQFPPGYGDALAPVYREEWVYNFGSRYLLRILTLENGRIVDVQNGSRGFD